MKSYVGVMALVVALSSPAMAQSIDAQKVAEGVAARHVAAFNKNDATALANLYTQDIAYLPPTGVAPVVGRAENEKRISAQFASEAPSERVTVTKAQKLDNHTILAFGEWYYTPSRGPNAGKEAHGQWMAVDVSQKGTWRIKALSSSVALPPSAPAANKQ